MHRKLVKLDPNNGRRFSEVDPIALQREASALKRYIEESIHTNDDPYEIRRHVLPLCEGVLDETLQLPLKVTDIPLEYPDREGLLPNEFSHLWSNFLVRATGSMLEPPDIKIINGDEYADMDFEDPGDWPDIVKQREREYSENLRKAVAADQARNEPKPPRSVPAGQPCPQAGYWFTPASRQPPRRFFNAGDIFPKIDSDYGSTFWQWSPNQKD